MRPALFRLATIAALGATMVSVCSAQIAAPENRLKAAIVSKFVQFVDWPLTSRDAPTRIDLCVGVPDPFGQDLDELVAGQQLNGRPIVARRVDRDADLAGCRVLYLPLRPDGRVHPLLHRASSLPILTVGDDTTFLDHGGIVQLRVVGGRVRFDVNAAAARRVGLRISSQLLQLAASVRGGGA